MTVAFINLHASVVKKYFRAHVHEAVRDFPVPVSSIGSLIIFTRFLIPLHAEQIQVINVSDYLRFFFFFERSYIRANLFMVILTHDYSPKTGNHRMLALLVASNYRTATDVLSKECLLYQLL